MDDEAILAGLDSEPDAFAVFYRRHVGALLEYLAGGTEDPQRAAELCAETFAAALHGARRFDPERETAAAWLDGIARRVLARHGSAGGRARRRLGLAPLEYGDRFIDDLEEELVEAARFRATRPRRRSPHVPARALAVAAGLALVAVVAAVALGRGGDEDRAANATPPPADGFHPLVPMLAAVDCGGRAVRDEPASTVMPDIGLLQRAQRPDDALPDDLLDGLPVGALDRSEPRLARDRRLTTRVHVVPSMAVSEDGRCDSNAGRGLCLVDERRGSFRCFGLTDVRAGRAVTRTPDGPIVGVVPDGIRRVIVTARGIVMAPVPVIDNVYEADYGVLAGTPVRIELPLPAGGCARTVSSKLLERVAALRRAPQAGHRLPQAAIDHLRGPDRRLGAIVADAARFWGARAGVEFWVVPAVPSGKRGCAAASRVCVVAVPEGARADAWCDDPANREGWRLAPLYAGNAVVLGIVPHRATGARVTIDDRTATVDARDNVMAGVLPFPHDDYATTSLSLSYERDPGKPVVGVVDATGA